ncbi:hypothetical protein DPMN_088225 [Dreissena polymorpha]|uniref:Uncharacterized protein n=1 Tax=Dreissena polymorpha TaxID=45954 RepID=A0A9D4KTQ3_DREPO|nr:hypothetical protein DPMN_088225 [Dreissena polymorpha]
MGVDECIRLTLDYGSNTIRGALAVSRLHKIPTSAIYKAILENFRRKEVKFDLHLYCVVGPSETKWILSMSGVLRRMCKRIGSRCAHIPGGECFKSSDTVAKDICLDLK